MSTPHARFLCPGHESVDVFVFIAPDRAVLPAIGFVFVTVYFDFSVISFTTIVDNYGATLLLVELVANLTEVVAACSSASKLRCLHLHRLRHVFVHVNTAAPSSTSTPCTEQFHHRALAIVDSVCIDHDRAYAAPDKAKFFSIKSRLLFLLLHPILGGYAMQDIFAGHQLHDRRVDFGPPHRLQFSAALTPVHRVEYRPPLHRLQSVVLTSVHRVDSGPPHRLHLCCIDSSPPC
jgi:hypothetical protein